MGCPCRFHVVWQVSSYVYVALLALYLIGSAGEGTWNLWLAALLAAAAYGGFWTAVLTRGYWNTAPRAIVDTIAAYAAIVIDGRPMRPLDINLRWVGATLSQNGVIEETGLSAGVMGHPTAGIAWLVNKLAPLQDGLKKGDIVLAAYSIRPVDIKPGDVIRVDYGELGGIGISFS